MPRGRLFAQWLSHIVYMGAVRVLRKALPVLFNGLERIVIPHAIFLFARFSCVTVAIFFQIL